jgi:hypothetical protein
VEVAALFLEALDEENLVHVPGDLVQRLEGQLGNARGRDVGEGDVDLGFAAREGVGKRVQSGVGHDILDAGTGQERVAHVSIVVLRDELLERVLGHEVRALVSRVGALDANLGAAAALGGERVGILGRRDVVGGVNRAAHVLGGREGRIDQ